MLLFSRRNAYRVMDIAIQYVTLCIRRFEHNIVFDADDSLQFIMFWFSCDYIVFQYNYHRCYTTWHVHYLCFSLCLVEGTHREHVQLVEVDTPEIAHIDGRGSTLNMLNMSRIHNSKSGRGRFLILTGCVLSDKSAMASWTDTFCQLLFFYIRLWLYVV